MHSECSQQLLGSARSAFTNTVLPITARIKRTIYYNLALAPGPDQTPGLVTFIHSNTGLEFLGDWTNLPRAKLWSRKNSGVCQPLCYMATLLYGGCCPRSSPWDFLFPRNMFYFPLLSILSLSLFFFYLSFLLQILFLFFFLSPGSLSLLYPMTLSLLYRSCPKSVSLVLNIKLLFTTAFWNLFHTFFKVKHVQTLSLSPSQTLLFFSFS